MTQPQVFHHTLAIVVDNESGVLARVIGLFSGRGYNIESLTVAQVDNHSNISRITIVTSGTEMKINQIKSQIERMVPVYHVCDLTLTQSFVDRELALLKVYSKQDKRSEALRIANVFGAKVVDVTQESFIFEITGKSKKVNAFVELLEPLGLCEIVRTGVAGIHRGKEVLAKK